MSTQNKEATKLFEHDKTTGLSLARGMSIRWLNEHSLLHMQVYELVIFLPGQTVHVLVIIIFTGVVAGIARRSRLEVTW